MSKEDMNELFEETIIVNKRYAKLIDSNASADDQVKALEDCKEQFQKIIDADLCREYSEWYEMQEYLKIVGKAALDSMKKERRIGKC